MKTGKYLLYMNYENIKMFICNTWIMKTGKYLLYMNYENIKIFICNTWIMKTGKYLLYWIMKTLKCLFAIHELWKCPFETLNYEKVKYLFAIQEL